MGDLCICRNDLEPSDSPCLFSPNARSRIGRRLSIQIFRICMTPMNRTKFSGSGNIKHHSHSMSDRRGPAIFFLSSGSLIYHRRGLPLLITPCTASFGLAEKGTTSCPLVFNGQRGLLVISKRNLSCRDVAILIGNASRNGATTTWIS